MIKDILEKKYMEHSWSKESHQAYKTEEIDESVKKFNDFLKLKKIRGCLLDIGCGNGKNTIFFQKKGFKSTGVDFSKTAIKIAKINSIKQKVNPSFQVSSILKYESKNKFDVVIDCGCLHHIRRYYWKTYKEALLENLNIGGYFYVHSISNCEENKKLPKHPNKRNWIINKKGHYTTFISYEDFTKLLSTNFKIEKHYQVKSRNSNLMIRVIYAKRIK
ncbi:class I SAM-dependent methyltransferase [Candidatus Woesearchaeota archaeon]|jgi:cyclopropane fatty-acyl-phospholipid synthase-like methyltransferase|nr:class I SAM-dependent methyltransferase [Candidatus Woesearchaeota archaeon]